LYCIFIQNNKRSKNFCSFLTLGFDAKKRDPKQKPLHRKGGKKNCFIDINAWQKPTSRKTSANICHAICEKHYFPATCHRKRSLIPHFDASRQQNCLAVLLLRPSRETRKSRGTSSFPTTQQVPVLYRPRFHFDILLPETAAQKR
jgi:hypothetical protein